MKYIPYTCCVFVVTIGLLVEPVIATDHHTEHPKEEAPLELFQPLPQTPTMPITGSAWN